MGATGGRATASTAVYAAAICAMFVVSAVYHRGRWSARVASRMRRADHCTIFVAIAGTYTPLALVGLRGTLGTAVLVAAWAVAALGIVSKLRWLDTPHWLIAAVYLVMGWGMVGTLGVLVGAMGATAVVLLLVGGLLYTGGAVVYARQRPDPAPAVFGFHEVFHALVIAGATCQYAAIALLVL